MSCCRPCRLGSGPCQNPAALGPVIHPRRHRRAQLGAVLSRDATTGPARPERDEELVMPSGGDLVFPSGGDLDELCNDPEWQDVPGVAELCAAQQAGETPELPPPPQGGLPGVVTEEECALREEDAYDEGRADGRSSVVLPAIVGGIASAAAGATVGWILRR